MHLDSMRHGGSLLRAPRGWLLAGLVMASGVAMLGAPPEAVARRHTTPSTGFLAGAGEMSTTPPLAGTSAAQQADQEFGPGQSGCPAALYPNQGRFALQEPFDDLNHNDQWDANANFNGPPRGVPEPYCDPNANGRWDGIYTDNGRGPADGVHDPIDVRAVAISYGHGRPVVYASADQIGMFDYYTEAVRVDLANTYKVNADLVVSANHNESSPDSLGLYGALQTPLGVGLGSGIDEYYMRYLEDRIAHAAAIAVRNLRPARLYAAQVEGQVAAGQSGNRYPLLTGMSQRISDQFPTSVALPGNDRVAAIDPKLGVLQARSSNGKPIFTVMSLAAHNQEMGNSGNGISADWPGAFERSFDAKHAGMAIYLVGDNGTEEDPESYPPVIPNGSENHTNQATQYRQVLATGARFAQIVAVAATAAQQLTPGPVHLTRQSFCVPLENNGFVALAAKGEFGLRQGYVCDQQGDPVAPVPNGSITPTVSTNFRTFVSYTDVGPDLQLIDNPGEAFPALMLGSPFGVSDQSCPRANPAVPTWHARAMFRFQVGLADDEIGYLIPAWGFASGTPGLYNNDTCYQDEHGHGHKLESESAGPTSANDVANRLTGLLDTEPDPSAHVTPGRFVLPSGSYSAWPTGAVAILLPAAGQATLDPNGGQLIGAPGTAGAGGRAVDATGLFMDYDGQPQAAPDVTTRGMVVLGAGGCVVARYYLNVFPPLGGSPVGRSRGERTVIPARPCRRHDIGGVAELQPLAAAQSGLPLSGASGRLARLAAALGVRRGARACPSAIERPHVAFGRRAVRDIKGVLFVGGRASAHSCRRRSSSRPARVVVSVSPARQRGAAGCRFVSPSGQLTAPRPCANPLLLLARGTSRWGVRLALHVPSGVYVVSARAVDAHGLASRVIRHGRLRVA